MALTLMLDGKPIGELDGDKLRDPKGKVVETEEKVETITVPARRQPTREANDDDEEEAPKPKAKAKVKEEDDTEDDTDEELDLDDRISSLLDEKLDRFLQQFQSTNTKTGDQEINLDSLDAIPDDAITPEKDPFGIARTLKNITKALKSQAAKVGRLDQAKGFDVAMKALEGEKAKYEIFTDKKLRGVAERLLNAELSTNKTDPISRIVKNVAREVERLTPKRTKEIIKAKEEAQEKVPQGIRRSDGQSPAITVNKPKSVAEASKAYQAWRRGSDKANRG